MNFFRDGLSVDESKVSVLMFALVVTLGFALWQFVTVGVMGAGILQLLAYEIGAITGINVVDKFANRNTNSYDKIGG
jgi:ABC-type antimicrobial peptide transport system permease subunit